MVAVSGGSWAVLLLLCFPSFHGMGLSWWFTNAPVYRAPNGLVLIRSDRAVRVNPTVPEQRLRDRPTGSSRPSGPWGCVPWNLDLPPTILIPGPAPLLIPGILNSGCGGDFRKLQLYFNSRN